MRSGDNVDAYTLTKSLRWEMNFLLMRFVCVAMVKVVVVVVRS